MTVLRMFWFRLMNAVLRRRYTHFQKREFRGRDGGMLPYRILYPDLYETSKRYPVVLLLHGAGERGDDNVRQLLHAAGLFVRKEVRNRFPCIAVVPQCPAGDFWSSVKTIGRGRPAVLSFDYSRPLQPALTRACELLLDILTKESADHDRVYITGLSMGGMGTFELVYHHPELFAAAVPVCGGGDAEAYAARASKIPCRIFHGKKDDVVNPEYSRRMAAQLSLLHADASYTEFPDAGHNSWDKAYSPEMLTWLFSKRRSIVSPAVSTFRK